MARVVIDTTNEKFGSVVTIADLAQNTPIFVKYDGNGNKVFKPIKDVSSDKLNIYQVEQAIGEEWKFELERFEFEYGTGYSGYFKDGSAIHVSATADCEDPSRYGWQ